VTAEASQPTPPTPDAAAALVAAADAEKRKRSPSPPAAEVADALTDTPPAPIDEGAAVRDCAVVVRLALRLGARFLDVSDSGADRAADEFGRRLGPTLAGWLGSGLGVTAGIAALVEWALERMPALPTPPKGGSS
jgi:hypothetical protein